MMMMASQSVAMNTSARVAVKAGPSSAKPAGRVAVRVTASVAGKGFVFDSKPRRGGLVVAHGKKEDAAKRATAQARRAKKELHDVAEKQGHDAEAHTAAFRAIGAAEVRKMEAKRLEAERAHTHLSREIRPTPAHAHTHTHTHTRTHTHGYLTRAHTHMHIRTHADIFGCTCVSQWLVCRDR